jgi:hypothetical protein
MIMTSVRQLEATRLPLLRSMLLVCHDDHDVPRRARRALRLPRHSGPPRPGEIWAEVLLFYWAPLGSDRGPQRGPGSGPGSGPGDSRPGRPGRPRTARAAPDRNPDAAAASEAGPGGPESAGAQDPARARDPARPRAAGEPGRAVGGSEPEGDGEGGGEGADVVPVPRRDVQGVPGPQHLPPWPVN